MNLFKRVLAACCFMLALTCSVYAQQDTSLSIIPYPVQLARGSGSFVIGPKTHIEIPAGNTFLNEASQLNDLIAGQTGKLLPIMHTHTTHSISLVYNAGITQPEGYKLHIGTQGIVIEAKDGTGAFRAVETIRQLLPVVAGSYHANLISLPALDIFDYPAYSWRGMHLDVARHFFSIAYLQKFIDVMALYKMNTLHLHLTDDQGWRIEIKKYPKLTEYGAWRTFNNQDSACMERAKDNPDFELDKSHIIQKDGKTLYGGFYTQVQMKALVAYAAARHVNIVPEIDMPGHMMAAINEYPFLTCNGVNKMGDLFSRPICPCDESTFEFAHNVFSEIMDIFPSKYIHIGGDEVDRSDWAKSDACKALMQREGIKDLPALQSYFINRMEKFFNAHGRTLVGWDEIIEGGISPTAVVTYWRGWVPDAPLKAVRNGNDVVMNPDGVLYFDSPANKSTLYNVYHFNMVPAGLNAQEAKKIIGAQADLWSESIPTESRADYMFMPRMTALAELLWSNNMVDYSTYNSRLIQQFPRLDALNVHYRLPDVDGTIDDNVFVQSDTLNLKAPLSSLTLRYTTDGSVPESSSPELGKLVIDKSMVLKVAAFTPTGKRGEIYAMNYRQQQPAEPQQPATTHPGLAASYYKAAFKLAAQISGKPDSTFIVDNIYVPATVNAPAFGIQYRGYIDVPQDGIYTFYLTSDDGSVLRVAGRETVNNDGLHPAIEKSGQVALKKGLQPFALDFIEGGGGFFLRMRYSVNGGSIQDMPSSWFKN